MQERKGIPLAGTTFISCKLQWLQNANQDESLIPIIHGICHHFKMLVQLKLLCLLLVCEVASLQQ